MENFSDEPVFHMYVLYYVEKHILSIQFYSKIYLRSISKAMAERSNLRSISKAMAKRSKERGRSKYKNLNMCTKS